MHAVSVLLFRAAFTDWGWMSCASQTHTAPSFLSRVDQSYGRQHHPGVSYHGDHFSWRPLFQQCCWLSINEATGEVHRCGLMLSLRRRIIDPISGFILANPTGALANRDEFKGTLTSNIFEAKRDNVWAALPQAVIATASHYKQHKYNLSLFLVFRTSSLFTAPKFTCNARLHHKWTIGVLCLQEGLRRRTRLFKRICYWTIFWGLSAYLRPSSWLGMWQTIRMSDI